LLYISLLFSFIIYILSECIVCLGCLIGGVINDDRPEAVATARNQVQSRARLKRTQKPEGWDRYRFGVASWCGLSW